MNPLTEGRKSASIGQVPKSRHEADLTDVLSGIIYLTPHGPDVEPEGSSANDLRASPAAPEIEITPAMIAAGAACFWKHAEGHEPSEEGAARLVADVYRAMALAK